MLRAGPEHEGSLSRTVILRPGFGRRISRDASDSHAVSRLFGEDSREEPRQGVEGRNIPGRSVRPTEGLRMTELESLIPSNPSCSFLRGACPEDRRMGGFMVVVERATNCRFRCVFTVI